MIMKALIALILSLGFLTSGTLSAQKYFSKTARVTFSSDAPMEKIEAANNKGTCVFDLGSGNLEFAILIKAFQFEKALMQEHFNENYMESDKFPKSTFKGKIVNFAELDLKATKEQALAIEGELTIHGVTQKIKTKGFIQKSGDGYKVRSNIEIAVADYGIKIPALVKDNIAKIVAIDISADLSAL